jgi:hypothetical protein
MCWLIAAVCGLYCSLLWLSCLNAYDSRALVRMPSVGFVLDVEAGVVSVSRPFSVAKVFRSESVDGARARKHGN